MCSFWRHAATRLFPSRWSFFKNRTRSWILLDQMLTLLWPKLVGSSWHSIIDMYILKICNHIYIYKYIYIYIYVYYVYVVNLLQFVMVKLNRLVKPLNPVLLPSCHFLYQCRFRSSAPICLVLVGGMLSDQIIHHLAWFTKQMGIKRMLVDAWHN